MSEREKYTLKDIYYNYRADGGELQKSLFKNICQDFNIWIMNSIIYDANIFDMGFELSSLSILRIKRNYSNPQVDWKASNERKKELLKQGKKLYDKETGEGHKWLVFHTSKEYCRFYWKKLYTRVKNKSAYRFRATRGKKGNKTKLKEHLRENDMNKLKYEKADK